MIESSILDQVKKQLFIIIKRNDQNAHVDCSLILRQVYDTLSKQKANELVTEFELDKKYGIEKSDNYNES